MIKIKKKILAKKLALIRHVATNNLSKNPRDMATIIESVADIAMEIGGAKFALGDINKEMEELRRNQNEKRID